MIRLLITHWIVDFVLQSSDMATRKSKELKVLFQHIGINFLGFFLVFMTFDTGYRILSALIAAFINAGLHGIIDWNLWNFYKKGKSPDHKFWEDHWFYVGIGFDQLLHMCILVGLYSLLV